MKNLKKVLSLALAFAMVLGLCVGAMAADTQDVTKLADWAEVTHKDAAQLLNAFGIMSGDNQGFRPADPVTRAEAAKMIMVAVWGGVDNAELFKDSNVPFTDVKGVTDWATGYIAAAYGYGIISGRNATTFDPKGNVTGYELLKMVLTAIGYDAECAGLVGANWDLNAMLIAKARGEADLTKSVDVTNWAAAINRENAAQVIANMVDRHTVKYNRTTDINDVSEKDTFGTAVLGLDTKNGVVAANAYGMIEKFAGKTTPWDTNNSGTANADKGQNTIIRIKNDKGELLDDKATGAYELCATDSGLYDIGATAKLYYKDNKLVSVVVTSPVELTPTATNNNDNVATVKAGNGGHDVTKCFDTDGDGKYDLTNTISYVAPTTVAANTVTDVVTSEKHGTVYVTGTAKWSSTYEKRASLSGLTGLLTDVVFVGDAAVKGDTIAYATTTNGNGETIKVAAVLENTTGTINRVVTANSTTTYYIDGVAHKGANLAFNDKGTFYFFPDGDIAALVKDDGTSAGETHYAVIYKAGYTATGTSTSIGGGVGTVAVQVAAILDNGESSTYNLTACDDVTVSKLSPSDVKSKLFDTGAPLNGTFNGNTQKDILVTYKLSDDGKSISVKTVKANDGLTTVSGATEAKTGVAKFGNQYFTSTTVTFVSNKADDETESWTVYTGIPTFGYTATGAQAVLYPLYSTANDGIKAMVVDDYTLTQAPTDTTAFVYILENKGQTGADTTTEEAIFTMTVYDAATGTVGDIEVKIAAAQVGTLNNVKAGDFCTSYTASTKTLNTTDPYASAAKGFVATCGNGVVVLTTVDGEKDSVTSTNTVYTYNTDTKFYFIDGENSKAITAADVTAQTPDTVGSDGHEYDAFYQAIVKATTGNVAERVIIFAERQGTTPTTSTR